MAEVVDEVFSAEKYFATQPPPVNLDDDVAKVRAFINRQKEAKRKVAFVTVGNHLSSTIRLIPSLEWRNDCTFRAECVSCCFSGLIASA